MSGFPEPRESARQPRPQCADWAGHVELGFLAVQEQSYPEDLGELQHSVSSGVFQRFQPRQLRFAHRQSRCLRPEWKSHLQCGFDYVDTNPGARDTVRAETDLVKAITLPMTNTV